MLSILREQSNHRDHLSFFREEEYAFLDLILTHYVETPPQIKASKYLYPSAHTTLKDGRELVNCSS